MIKSELIEWIAKQTKVDELIADKIVNVLIKKIFDGWLKVKPLLNLKPKNVTN